MKKSTMIAYLDEIIPEGILNGTPEDYLYTRLPDEPLYMEKFKLLHNAEWELSAICYAHMNRRYIERNADYPEIEGYLTFSKCCSLLQESKYHATAISFLLEMAKNWDFNILNPKFEFSDNPEKFHSEIYDLAALYFNTISIQTAPPLLQEQFYQKIKCPKFPPKDDPRFDLAIMKALFNAGKIIANERHEGTRLSDEQSRKGGKRSGNHVGWAAVFDAFYRVDRKGLTLPKIGKLIEDHLKEIEKKKPKHKQKTVYTYEHIYKKILKSDEKIKSILLKEGILKE